ncbi:uncharacterized protein PV09_08710 [Verruconis gallopava]|uniref:Acyl-CoA dehydrogenase/oxidase C-terminal domain-containing protein n=1 Tax=Verruconis gallopava TaxID=253628 RepID=A0A0D2AKU9_9PEZI|nr:uncharacterized protein PV09_08710 [Verruconis gallopava]KIV99653.1 hypothetical protein PV09_08710 [Verruconis gallopava]
MKPSSGTTGFFQQAPSLEHPFQDDYVLRRIFDLHLPASIRREISSDLDAFGSLVVSPYVYSLVADAERNPPSISTHTTFGVPKSELHTGRGWRELQALGIKEGIVAIGYEGKHGQYSRVHQFLKNHMWSPSAAMVTCPSAMTDGAARLLSKHLAGNSVQQDVFRKAYANLTSRDPAKAWTSGQWMTERTGGSDVRGTETVATLLENGNDGAMDAHGSPLGPYSISGFKWFSSATDSNMTVMLAQTGKGLGVFMAPMRKSSPGKGSVLNGITIQRLKPKMGTKPVPTAELVLDGTRAWMIGAENTGVREIATVLNITRVYTGLGSIGYWGRGLAIARAFARVRKVDGGKSLAEMPAHLNTMAKNMVNYAAMMHLGFFVVSLLGISEEPKAYTSGKFGKANNLVSDLPEAVALLRLLTAVMKAQCSKMAIHGLQECMEALGGVGYLEDEQEYNIARLFRDCNVNSIWEGTTDVMAWDVVRVMKGREGDRIRAVLFAWAERHADSWKGSVWSDAGFRLKSRVNLLCDEWSTQDGDELKFRGRDLLEELAWIVATVSLVSDALRDEDEVAVEIAKRWVGGSNVDSLSLSRPDWKEVSKMNKKIVFGSGHPTGQARL